jgi:hypothetical protein
MRIEVHAEFGSSLNNVFAVHSSCECLVFHLLPDAGHLHFGDHFCRFDQGAGSEETGKFVAGKEHLVEVSDALYAGVLRVSEDRGTQFLRPSAALEFANADEGMFLRSGVTLVIEIVKKGSGRVELKQSGALIALKAETVGFHFAVGGDADLYSLSMFAKAFVLSPLTEQVPGALTTMLVASILSDSHVVHFTCCDVWFAFFRVSWGCLGVCSVCA